MEAARALGAMGADLALVYRNKEKAERVVEDIGSTATGKIDLVEGDMASFASIRSLATEVLQHYPKIDVFMSNAGVFRVRRKVTKDGLEEVFGVNHLAPFLLTSLLLDRLKESAPSRIVVTASAAHYGAVLDFDDLLLEKHYRPWRSYSRSKLANIMFTYALARRLEGTGVTVNCLHPGFVATNLGSGNLVPMRPVYMLLRPFARTSKQGAETPVYLASSPDVDGVSGKYFDDKKEARSSRASHDEDAQELLWDHSARLTGASVP
jgi:NAD(P)-dependent dehydrogenase (short-subunit alcohol dehydrogenase family)